MNNVNNTNNVKQYIDNLITDAVQDDITCELAGLNKENKDIAGLLESMVLDSEVKKQAAEVLAEVLIDNSVRITALMQQLKQPDTKLEAVTTL